MDAGRLPVVAASARRPGRTLSRSGAGPSCDRRQACHVHRHADL